MDKRLLKAIDRAFELISTGICTRVDMDSGVAMHKHKSKIPGTYTIRLDIRVKEK